MVDKKKESDRLAKRLGKNIASRRKQLEWTQEQVAERVGVDAETISRFERGVNLPSLLTLESLSAVLHLSIDELLANKKHREAASEVAAFEVLVSNLTAAERALVMTLVRSCCNHFSKPAK